MYTQSIIAVVAFKLIFLKQTREKKRAKLAKKKNRKAIKIRTQQLDAWFEHQADGDHSGRMVGLIKATK